MKKFILTVIVFVGLFILKPLNAYTIDQKTDEIYVGGQTIGLKLNTGVTVSGTYAVQNGTTLAKPWQQANILEGDTIKRINENEISMVDELLGYLAESGGKTVKLEIVRAGKTFTTQITPILKNGKYSLGLYIKDNILGIGTLTYVVPGANIFGSLGHQIQTDKNINGGTVYKAEVTGVDKGEIGHAGSKKANIKNQVLGSIEKNTITGVHGKYDGDLTQFHKMKVKPREEVSKGKAQIYTCINGYSVEAYDIEIISVAKQKTKDVKGIRFKIVDEELLNLTGGVIQGMSGSPIIQDNQIVGAITHVLVNEPQQGYGIFIEFMLAEMDVNLM